MSENERRYLLAATETRAIGDEDDDEDELALEGYASTFGDEYSVDEFQERTMPGCFRSSLERGDDVKALWSHDPKALVLKRFTANVKPINPTARPSI